MPSWLVTSLVASLVLTLVLNLGLRLFPGLGRKAEERFLAQMESQVPDGRKPKRRVQVFFPWKTMIVVSVLATIALNVFV